VTAVPDFEMPPALAESRSDYVTARVDGQLFGIPIAGVHDVYNLGPVTPVPLAHPAVLGLLNLRGRVVTAIDLRRRLGRPAGSEGDTRMAIGIDAERQSYCLVADAVGEIVSVPAGGLEPNPIHLDECWAAMSRGVHRTADELILVLDVAAVLQLESPHHPVRPS
jgi:purine-binding chemotaxis protein CheW